jgi:hypothetical protein
VTTDQNHRPSKGEDPDVPRSASDERDEIDTQAAGLQREIAELRAEIRSLTSAIERARNDRALAAAPWAPVYGLAATRLHAIAATVSRIRRWRTTKSARWAVPPRAEWTPGRSLVWHVVAVGLVALAAILLRFVHLETIPYGMHGDEAMAVLEGRRTLEIGWFGVWNNMAGGFPAGFIYLAAPMVWLFGDSLLAVRYLASGLDIVAVLALYVTLRRSFGFGTAVTGSALLAVSAWHIQFSRIAFPNILWPTLVLLSCLALGEAIRRESLGWWAASGAIMALAIYSYNSHFLYLGVVGIFLAFHFMGWRGIVTVTAFGAALLTSGWVAICAVIIGCIAVIAGLRRMPRARIPDAACYLAGLTAAAAPMASFIVNNRDRYFSRGRNLSIFRTEEWTALSGLDEKVRFLFDRYWQFWVELTSNTQPDAVDGSGAAVIIPLSAMAICCAGAVLGLLRRRHPLVDLAIFTVVLMPMAAVATNDLALRRSMIIAPFIALLGGLGVVEIVRLAWTRRVFVRVATCLALVALLAHVGYRSVDGFFNRTAKSDNMQWVMSVEWVEASKFMDQLPEGSYVYVYSERWPYTHEIRAMVAPEIPGESRGDRFGENSMTIDYSKGRPVLILLGKYKDALPEFEARYPGGETRIGPPDRRSSPAPSYIAYILPATMDTGHGADLSWSASIRSRRQ